MKKLEKLQANLDKAIASYDSVKTNVTTASERVNVAAQLFSMNEVEKDVLVEAIEARDAIKATKAPAWDAVVVADAAYTTFKKSSQREDKVAELKKMLKELSK